MTIDIDTILSSFDDKCTLLQELKKINKMIEDLTAKIALNNLALSQVKGIMIVEADMNTEENVTNYDGEELALNINNGNLFQLQSQYPAHTKKWVKVFTFAKAV